MRNPETYLGGIDICAEDGEIRWNEIRNSKTLFCMVKATEGVPDEISLLGYVEDPAFCKNAREAHLCGFRVGAYHYLTAKNIGEAREQAKGFLKVLGKAGHQINFYCGVVCPDELPCDAEDMALCLDVFCSIISEAGYNPIVHAPLSFLEEQDISYGYWLPFDGNLEDLSAAIRDRVVLWQYRGMTAACDSGKVFRSALLDSTVLFEQIFNKTVIRYSDKKRREGKLREINSWAIRNGILPIDGEIPCLEKQVKREEVVDMAKRFVDYWKAAYGAGKV